MPLRELTNRTRLAAFLVRDPALHLYELGDLDPLYWSRCRFFGWEAGAGGALQAVSLLFAGVGLPTLVALEAERPAAAGRLVTALGPTLPDRFYAHFSPGGEGALGDDFTLDPYGPHQRLVLSADQALAAGDDPPLPIRALGDDDRPAIQALRDAAYPDSWFDPRTLALGLSLGCFAGGALVGMAGIHVFSPEHSVAALGNVAVHPAHRGRGLATALTAALCRRLRARGIRTIGLNVKADNAAARRCYDKLGFTHHADYGEFTVTRRSINRGRRPG